MRYVLAGVLLLCLIFSGNAPAYAGDEPLICVETGRVGVLDIWSYDPPDPCFL